MAPPPRGHEYWRTPEGRRHPLFTNDIANNPVQESNRQNNQMNRPPDQPPPAPRLDPQGSPDNTITIDDLDLNM